MEASCVDDRIGGGVEDGGDHNTDFDVLELSSDSVDQHVGATQGGSSSKAPHSEAIPSGKGFVDVRFEVGSCSSQNRGSEGVGSCRIELETHDVEVGHEASVGVAIAVDIEEGRAGVDVAALDVRSSGLLVPEGVGDDWA